jgi:hypothetical protein
LVTAAEEAPEVKKSFAIAQDEMPVADNGRNDRQDCKPQEMEKQSYGTDAERH